MGYEISLVSTFHCDPQNELKNYACLPIAFSRFSSGQPTTKAGSGSKDKNWIRRLTPGLQTLRYYLGPLTILRYLRAYQKLVHTWQPDLVHALRIPFEGMLASFTPYEIPFVVATWGNDLTLHARGSLLMRWFTRRTLKRATGITSDTHRDIELALRWGLAAKAHSLVVPGSGGLDMDAIQKAEGFDPLMFQIPDSDTWIVNPRGIRPGSVHQESFFAAVPRVIAEYPQAVFICPGLAGMPQAQAWVRKYALSDCTFLLPKLPQEILWSLFKRSQLFISPSSHDGTPNTLLEAMACGCFPIAGDIESLREWLVHDQNGLLIDPRDPDQIANAIIYALTRPDLRIKAADQNLNLVENRASRQVTSEKINGFYHQFLE